MEDMVAAGRQAKGERHGMVKLTDAQVEQIRELHREGFSQQVLANQFGVRPPCISKIVNYKRRAKKTYLEPAVVSLALCDSHATGSTHTPAQCPPA